MDHDVLKFEITMNNKLSNDFTIAFKKLSHHPLDNTMRYLPIFGFKQFPKVTSIAVFNEYIKHRGKFNSFSEVDYIVGFNFILVVYLSFYHCKFI